MREEVGEQNPDENTRDAPSENGGGEGRRGALRSHRCFILNGEKWLITWEKYQTGYRCFKMQVFRGLKAIEEHLGKNQGEGGGEGGGGVMLSDKNCDKSCHLTTYMGKNLQTTYLPTNLQTTNQPTNLQPNLQRSLKVKVKKLVFNQSKRLKAA